MKTQGQIDYEYLIARCDKFIAVAQGLREKLNCQLNKTKEVKKEDNGYSSTREISVTW